LDKYSVDLLYDNHEENCSSDSGNTLLT